MAGRPTSYKPAYCEEVIECLSQGHSVAGFAGLIGVAASTVYEWIKRFPEFAEAYGIAQAKCALCWEKRVIDAAESGKGNATLLMYGLQNRVRGEWQDIRRHEHTGKDGEPIKTEEVSARDEITRRIAGIAARTETAGSSGRLN